jgi:uncharacterized protein YecE (DUF72 family)
VGQLGLFGDTSEVSAEARVRAVQHPRWIEAGRTLPKNVLLGTSSWTFPGWGGIVYEGKPTSKDLLQGGLRAYAENPIFRTVGIDRSHYAPLTTGELERYASMLPPRYPTLSKMWDEVSLFAFPPHPRFGVRAGQRNPRFFDPALAIEEVLPAYDSAFAEHTAPFIVEVAPIPSTLLPSRSEFAERADGFFGALPKRFRYALELRSKELMSRELLRVLASHGVGYVFNFWTGMPTLGAQIALPGSLTTDFVVARLMLPPYQRYADKRAEYAPFDALVSPELGMREDVVTLIQRAGDRTCHILVGNKAEGCAPLTALAIAEDLADATRSR